MQLLCAKVCLQFIVHLFENATICAHVLECSCSRIHSYVTALSLQYFLEDFLEDTIYNIRTVLHGCQENIGSGIFQCCPMPKPYICCWDNISTVLLKRLFGRYSATFRQCSMVFKKILGLASVCATPLVVKTKGQNNENIHCQDNISTVLSKRLQQILRTTSKQCCLYDNIRCWDNVTTVFSRRLFGIYYKQHPASAAWLSRKYWIQHLLVLPHCLSDASAVGTTSLQYF